MWKTLKNNGSSKEPKSLDDPMVDLNGLNGFFLWYKQSDQY